MTWWQAIILGLVEGITEYLPVSSTGHLILAQHLIGMPSDHDEAIKHFEVVVQGGAILAVLGLYWPRVLQMLRGLTGRDRDGLRLLINLVVAFIPAALLGLLLHDLIEEHLFGVYPVLAALAVGGVYMIALDRWARRRHQAGWANLEINDLTPRKALVIGCMQVIAMWPGTSRSMMTITGGYVVGLKPKAAAEFSFLLGLPTLGAAAAYSLYKDLKGSDGNLFQQLGHVPVLLGLIVATISAAAAVKWLVAFLTKHGLTAFGAYRLILCAVLGALVLTGVITV